MFACLMGYSVQSYRHYFLGGWEAAGYTHPFNEDLMFAMALLMGVSALSGFSLWIWMYWQFEPIPTLIQRLKIFGFGTVGLVAICSVLVFAVPLSFEAPIDLNLCDGSAGQPTYCPASQ